MAFRTNFSLLAVLILLVISGQALAGRQTPKKSKDVDVKQSDFLFKHKHDNSFLIPGIGRVLVPPHPGLPSYRPPQFSIPSYGPYTGTGNYIPGRDDTLVPNPGNETPNPGRAGSVPATDRP